MAVGGVRLRPQLYGQRGGEGQLWEVERQVVQREVVPECQVEAQPFSAGVEQRHGSRLGHIMGLEKTWTGTSLVSLSCRVW